MLMLSIITCCHKTVALHDSFGDEDGGLLAGGGLVKGEKGIAGAQLAYTSPS